MFRKRQTQRSRICRPPALQTIGKVEHLESRRMLDGQGFDDLSDADIDSRIESYKNYFDGVINGAHSNLLGMADRSGGNGWNLYNLQLAVDGVLSMYEATGDIEVLESAIEYTQRVMDSARVIENGHYERDGFLDWEALSGGRPQANRWGNMLYDFQYGSAMSRLARLIVEDESLADRVEIIQFGDELADFIDEQIVFKWLDARGQRDWLEQFYDRGYWTDKATHIITICNNMTHIMGADSSCDGVHVTLGEQFKNLLVVENDGAYVWSQHDTFPGGNFNLAPDTNHENRVATMISQLGADDVVFDRNDIQHLGATFTERIWNGRTDWEDTPGIQESPWFHNYIDGSDDQYRNYVFTQGPEGMNGFVYDGCIRLGEFVPDVQAAGEALLAFIQDTAWNVNSVRIRNGSTFGKLALTGHLAKNLRSIQAARAESTIEESAAEIGAGREFVTSNRTARLGGDSNADGRVDFADFLVVARNFGKRDTQSWTTGDFTGDGRVDMTDFLILAAAFADSA